jgi:hypothetical protein
MENIVVNENIIMSIIARIPIWFLCLIVGIFIFHKFCDSNIKMIIRILAKHKARDERKDREQDNRLTMLEAEQRTIKDYIKSIKEDINNILEVITK